MVITWDNIDKSGQASGGWEYNEPNLEYNSDTDPDSGVNVYYNNIGELPTFTNISKS